MMYYEGLKVIEATVKEVGKADIQYVRNRGQEVFTTAKGVAFESAELLKRVRFSTRGEFRQWIREHFLWNCYVHRQGVETLGVRGYTANGSEADYFYELMWHERRMDGSYDWVQAHYDYDTHSEAQCGSPFPCASANTQDITRNPRVLLANIYNYSDSDRVEEVRTMRAELGDTADHTRYLAPRIWYAADNTPFLYFNLYTLLRPLSLPIFSAPMYFQFTIAIVSDPWVEMMRSYQTEAKLLVAQMDAGPQSIVLAGRGVAGVDPPQDCRGGGQNSASSLHPCMRYVLHLDEEVRDIVSQMTTQPVDTFTEIRGHWGPSLCVKLCQIVSVCHTGGFFHLKRNRQKRRQAFALCHCVSLTQSEGPVTQGCWGQCKVCEKSRKRISGRGEKIGFHTKLAPK